LYGYGDIFARKKQRTSSDGAPSDCKLHGYENCTCENQVKQSARTWQSLVERFKIAETNGIRRIKAGRVKMKMSTGRLRTIAPITFRRTRRNHGAPLRSKTSNTPPVLRSRTQDNAIVFAKFQGKPLDHRTKRFGSTGHVDGRRDRRKIMYTRNVRRKTIGPGIPTTRIGFHEEYVEVQFALFYYRTMINRRREIRIAWFDNFVGDFHNVYLMNVYSPYKYYGTISKCFIWTNIYIYMNDLARRARGCDDSR